MIGLYGQYRQKSVFHDIEPSSKNTAMMGTSIQKIFLLSQSQQDRLYEISVVDAHRDVLEGPFLPMQAPSQKLEVRSPGPIVAPSAKNLSDSPYVLPIKWTSEPAVAHRDSVGIGLQNVVDRDDMFPP
jgi:hypothetical protein